MDIILTGNGGSVRFPVLPDSYSFQSTQDNSSVNINAIGEVTLLGHRNLRTLSWSGIFPLMNDSFVHTTLHNPKSYVTTIEAMKRGGPCMIHFLDVVSMYCTIEDFSYKEQDGTGTLYYDINLKEYVYISSGSSSADDSGTINIITGRSGKAQKTRLYTVKKGDNLFMIARRELNSTNWMQIYEMNIDVIGNDPDVLVPGTVLILPVSE